MISTLITIQTICIGVSSYLVYKSNNKSTKLRLKSNMKGFKYYNTGGY